MRNGISYLMKGTKNIPEARAERATGTETIVGYMWMKN